MNFSMKDRFQFLHRPREFFGVGSDEYDSREIDN